MAVQLNQLLPDLRRARDFDQTVRIDPALEIDGSILDQVEAEGARRRAAVVANGYVVRRAAWSKVEELAPTTLEGLQRLGAAEPGASGPERSYRRLGEEPARPQRCTHCSLYRGKMVCAACNMGSIFAHNAACFHCVDGLVPCSFCDGRGKTWRAQVDYVTDKTVPLRHVFHPSLPEPSRRAVSRVLMQVTPLPDCLVLDLDRVQASSPYRDRRTGQHFHGYEFGRALDSAERLSVRLERLASVQRHEVRLYAWPMLIFDVRLPSYRGQLVLFELPDGRTCLTGARD